LKTLELALVVIAAVALAVWRGVALYQQTFRRKGL
jgi:hypothetical protein